jgi:DNA (cytosine-5)-methyltransferase 1
MPKMRSGLSRDSDNYPAWFSAMDQGVEAIERIARSAPESELKKVADRATQLIAQMNASEYSLPRWAPGESSVPASCPLALKEWIVDDRIKRLPNNETRRHMVSDLGRYLFASIYAEIFGASPKAKGFPADLAPSHQNWLSGNFNDRFRVQLWNAPSTTVTSHISKDGHYFIHPDPSQCRTLTVREAARLQTFPDNYFFTGTRTQQYVQVGNAVPPFLARQIAEAVYSLLQ